MRSEECYILFTKTQKRIFQFLTSQPALIFSNISWPRYIIIYMIVYYILVTPFFNVNMSLMHTLSAIFKNLKSNICYMWHCVCMEPLKGHDTHSTLSEVRKQNFRFFVFLIFCFFDLLFFCFFVFFDFLIFCFFVFFKFFVFLFF